MLCARLFYCNIIPFEFVTEKKQNTYCSLLPKIRHTIRLFIAVTQHEIYCLMLVLISPDCHAICYCVPKKLQYAEFSRKPLGIFKKQLFDLKLDGYEPLFPHFQN